MIDAAMWLPAVVLFGLLPLLPLLAVPRAGLVMGSRWRLQHGRRWPLAFTAVPLLLAAPLWLLTPLAGLYVAMWHEGRPCVDHAPWAHIGLFYALIAAGFSPFVLVPCWVAGWIAWARTRWTELEVVGGTLRIRRPWPRPAEDLPLRTLTEARRDGSRFVLKTERSTHSWPVPRARSDELDRCGADILAAVAAARSPSGG